MGGDDFGGKDPQWIVKSEEKKVFFKIVILGMSTVTKYISLYFSFIYYIQM